MGKKWRIFPHDAHRIDALCRSASVPPIVAQLLLSRGIETAQPAQSFLDCKLTGLRDPEDLPGASEAAQRIHDAAQAGRKIVIYGDYDVDGISGTSLLWQCLRMLGAEVEYYVPNRLEEGYGLNCDALKQLAQDGAKLVVTVDCGITSVEEAQLARELGLELIVSDHHSPGPQLPDAATLVHPALPGSDYPFDGLCGAGVAFKIAWAVCQQSAGAKRVGKRMQQFLLDAALASLGTVADVVPLMDENRIIVRHGLTALQHRPSTGLRALMKVGGLENKERLGSDDIGFILGPRLNAAGRLGEAELAIELLTTDDEARAAELAEYINDRNASRQSLERSIYLGACKQVEEQFRPDEDCALVLAERGWHAGVIGIVASRLVDKYYRPVVVIALDKLGVQPGKGSGRSIPGFHLSQALMNCGSHLLSHGGHAAAAGLKIDEHKVDHFRADFCGFAAETLQAEQLVAGLRIDAEAPFSAFTPKVMQQLSTLEPFGPGNPRPMICASDVELAAPPRRMGGGGRHLELRLRQHGVPMRAVAFGQGDWCEDLEKLDGPFEIAFRPVVNTFRGLRRIELHVADWRTSSVSAVAKT